MKNRETRKMYAWQNARFLIFVNDGFVKVTLRDGQALHWSKAWHNGEGWSAEGLSLSYDGGIVRRVDFTDGTDCDGRLSTTVETECDCGKLAGRDVSLDGERWRLPQWEEVNSSQYDQFAEMAGY